VRPPAETRAFADAVLWVQEAESRVEVLRRATDAARLLVGTSFSYCATPVGDELRLVAHSGFRNPATARRWRLPLGQGIGGRVFVSGEPAVIKDYQHDPRRERYSKSVMDAEGGRCAICVPVRSGERVAAVLWAAEHQLRRFTSEEVEVLTLFARSTGAALRAAEEREEVERKLQVLEDAGRRTRELALVLGDVSAALTGDGGLEAALGVLDGEFHAAASVRDARGRLTALVGLPTGPDTRVPIVAGRRVLGTLSVARELAPGTPERRCLEQVTRVLALWLMKERALDDERGFSSHFLDDLLHGRLGVEADVERHAAILGIDLSLPWMVLCVGFFLPGAGSAEPPPMTRLAADALRATAEALGFEPVLDLRGGDAVLLLRAPGLAGQPARAPVARLLREAGAALGGPRLAGGLGRACRQLAEYADSYREAALALRVARMRPEGSGLRTHEDLGFYGLMAQAVAPERLETMARQTLAPLIKEDTERGTQYVRTLEGYLSADRRLKPAAAALHVHPNTVRYRLARIQRMLQVELEEPEDRFPVELAVRLLQVPARRAPVAGRGAG
jgi:sugar diacid utilization regulator/putative methionine-R-sulfoxide reductase with GAF domain